MMESSDNYDEDFGQELKTKSTRSPYEQDTNIKSDEYNSNSVIKKEDSNNSLRSSTDSAGKSYLQMSSSFANQHLNKVDLNAKQLLFLRSFLNFLSQKKLLKVGESSTNYNLIFDSFHMYTQYGWFYN